MNLNSQQLRKIALHAIKEYPEECCGFVRESGQVVRCENIQNRLHRKDPKVHKRNARQAYTLSVEDTINLNMSFESDAPASIIYHSHPDVGAYFSDEDVANALYCGEPVYPVKYLVVDVKKHEVSEAKLFAWTNNNYECVYTFPLNIMEYGRLEPEIGAVQ